MGAAFRKKRGTRSSGISKSCVEDAVDQLPAFRLHVAHALSSFSSQALASFQSRRTVSCETLRPQRFP